MLIQKMVELIESSNENLNGPALRYLGDVMRSEDERIIDKALNADIMEKLLDVMHSPNMKVVKYCLWIISNITASDSSTKYQRAFLNSSLVQSVLELTES